MNRCKELNINFLKLKYKIPESASTTGREASETMTLADDHLILIFEDKLRLSSGISILNETFKNFRLRINAKKTKTMILNTNMKEENMMSQALDRLS